jgi:hypothetical protein
MIRKAIARIFYTVRLTPDDWLFMLPFFFASPIAMELIKTPAEESQNASEKP